MADLRNLLRAYAVDRDEEPSAWVARLDRAADRRGIEAAATCVVGRLRPGLAGAWQLRWTSAGHLPPLLVRSGGGAELLETPADLMLGVEPSSPRADHEVDLRPGDLLVLYSDGLVEVRGASLDERLETLRCAADRLAGAHPDEAADSLLAALAAHATDDVAVLAVQVLPPA
jgi:serine phosphatase RsbU (regulator of sigma subunit)